MVKKKTSCENNLKAKGLSKQDTRILCKAPKIDYDEAYLLLWGDGRKGKGSLKQQRKRNAPKLRRLIAEEGINKVFKGLREEADNDWYENARGEVTKKDFMYDISLTTGKQFVKDLKKW